MSSLDNSLKNPRLPKLLCLENSNHWFTHKGNPDFSVGFWRKILARVETCRQTLDCIMLLKKALYFRKKSGIHTSLQPPLLSCLRSLLLEWFGFFLIPYHTRSTFHAHLIPYFMAEFSIRFNVLRVTYFIFSFEVCLRLSCSFFFSFFIVPLFSLS